MHVRAFMRRLSQTTPRRARAKKAERKGDRCAKVSVRSNPVLQSRMRIIITSQCISSMTVDGLTLPKRPHRIGYQTTKLSISDLRKVKYNITCVQCR